MYETLSTTMHQPVLSIEQRTVYSTRHPPTRQQGDNHNLSPSQPLAAHYFSRDHIRELDGRLQAMRTRTSKNTSARFEVSAGAEHPTQRRVEENLESMQRCKSQEQRERSRIIDSECPFWGVRVKLLLGYRLGGHNLPTFFLVHIKVRLTD